LSYICGGLTIYPINTETVAIEMRERCRLRMFENKVLRRIFGPKRDEVTGEWRRLHNKELHVLYFSPDIIRVVKKTEMGRICSTYGERCLQGFSGETWGKDTTWKTQA
jgi:hypothetical protein